MTKRNKILIVIGCIVLFFILTNPSMKSFKEYEGETSYKGLKRKYNFIMFSIYKNGSETYIGVAKNFFYLGYYPEY